MSIRKSQRIVAVLLTLCCICVCLSMPVSAAGKKTVTKSYDVISVYSNIKPLSGYGRDTFKITYDGKKVISCSASQSKYDLGSGIFKKGGIKCTKKTAAKWTYQSIWSVNLRLLPFYLQPIAKKYAPEISAIQKLGTIVQVTTTYEVRADGSLKRIKSSLKWFTTIARYKNQIVKILKF